MPKKLLLPIGNITLIEYVYRQAVDADIGQVYIATPDQELERVCRGFANNVVLTPPTINGTHCCYHANDIIKADIVINIQGDCVGITPNHIHKLYKEFCKFHPDGVQTGHYTTTDIKDARNPARVKQVMDCTSKVLYFSREPIPHNSKQYNIHVGIYGFWADDLKYIGDTYELFCGVNFSMFEGERLEQLTWQERGINIYTTAMEPALSVDVQEDYEKAIDMVGA